MIDEEGPQFPAAPVPPAEARRLVFMGSPEVAVGTLRALVDAGFEVVLVVSRADRRRGRGGRLSPSPVKAAALELGLPTSEDAYQAARVGAELAVVVAYGRLIKPDLLAQLPFVNLHFSLLPRWRGAAPVERALLAGDERTGVCVMAMDEGLDTGPVYRRAEVVVETEDTVTSLGSRLAERGTALLLACLAEGFGSPQPQQGEAVYAAKIDPAELRLDWQRPAWSLARTVALGRAWTTFRSKRLLVHDAVAVGDEGAAGDPSTEPGTMMRVAGAVRVGTGQGWLELRQLQPEGRARQGAAAWCNGNRPTPGERLGA